MVETFSLDERWKMEKSLDFRRRLILLMVALFFLIFFFLRGFEHQLAVVGSTLLVVLYLVYLIVTQRIIEAKSPLLWWTGFILDLTFVGLIIAVCGKITSPYTLLYPLVMLGVAPGCPRVRDFVIAGALGHISYSVAVFSFTGDFSYYLEPVFWIEGGLNGVVFLISVHVVQFLIKDRQKLYRLGQELEEKNKRLEEIAVTDSLTGLYNHKCFWERLDEEVERAKRGKHQLVVLMCDIDFFKTYNDRLGHLQGDKVLQQLSKLLQDKVRKGDITCRYGGEEFGVILPETNIKTGMAVAERIREEVAKTRFEGCELMPSKSVTISIGVAGFPQDADNIRDLVNRADNALYGAKQRSKNRVQAYHFLLEDLKKNGADDEDLFKTMEVMISIINAKDRYTGGHSERVAEYVKAVGQRMGMHQDNLRVLTYAAFLHDLGKIEIDRKILNKAEPLTTVEMEDIKKHTLYGVNILEPILTSQRLIPAIKYHHERYDGSGYPEGLKGEQIPIEARILSLADSYDAMRSERPYRSALDFQFTIAELRKNAGGQFDPQLIDTFIEVVKDYEENNKAG